ncbi:hypothetical protein AAVH_17394, partial [Aphelenchoides avenae]
YAILQLLIQVLLTAFYLCMLCPADAPVRGYALKSFLYIFDALCLSGSVCLMFTSKIVRQDVLIFIRLRKPDKYKTSVVAVTGHSVL